MSGALVHEWLARTGGSENVFEQFVRMFPDAQRFALWNDSDGRFDGVRETWLARTPLRRSKAAALPFMPLAWSTLPRSDAEWVLISSHLFAHHARFRGPAHDAPTLVYAHTPARYIWVPELDGRGDSRIARTVGSALKPLDRKRAQTPTAIAANSKFVAKRIEFAWGRQADVIYPPVSVDEFADRPDTLSPTEHSIVEALPAGFLLGVSRFVEYKRLDAAIEAGRAAGLPVVLAGSGPDEARLRAVAAERHPGGVTFIDHPSFALLKELYHRSLALVFAPVEDFGIIPVEAMAAGTPVIANMVGGAAESVVHGRTGALVEEWSGTELRSAVELAVSRDRADCIAQAQKFSPAVFEAAVRNWMRDNGVSP